MKGLRYKLKIILIPFILLTSLFIMVSSSLYYLLLISNLVSIKNVFVEIISMIIPLPYVYLVFRHRVKIVMERHNSGGTYISGPRTSILFTIGAATLFPLFTTLMLVGKLYAIQTGILNNADIPAGITTMTLGYAIFSYCFAIVLVFVLLLSCRISTLNLDKYLATRKN